MSLEETVARCGYWIVFGWTVLEGETVLVMAGFLAHRGYLRLDGVIAAAFAGSLLGDQVIFHVGRRRGRAFLGKRPRWKARADRVRAPLERWRDAYIVGFRFLHGLRTISPLVIGTGDVRPRRFLLLNALGAALWAASLGAAGWLFGGALEVLLDEPRRYELWILGAIAVVGAALWAVRRLRTR